MLIYLICYAAGMLFAAGGYYGMSGLSLMLAAAYLYCYDYLRTENPLHLRALGGRPGSGLSEAQPSPDGLEPGNVGLLFRRVYGVLDGVPFHGALEKQPCGGNGRIRNRPG